MRYDPDIADRFVRPRDNAASVEEDVAPYRGKDLAFHGEMLRRVLGLAARILNSRPDRGRVLAHRDPRSPESQALWRRLICEAKGK